MCHPALFAIGAIVSTVTSVAGQVQAGKARAAQANVNAQLAERQATDTIAKGEAVAQEAKRQRDKLAGTMQMKFAGGGSAMEVPGSAMGLMADEAAETQLEQLTIRNNAQRAAYGYQIESSDYRFQSDLAQREAGFGAASTAIAGATQVASSWYGWKQDYMDATDDGSSWWEFDG